MKHRIAFQLTDRERDALLVLDANPVAWPTFERRTWQSLVNKRLVRVTPRPTLTHPGELFVSFTRALASFTSGSGQGSIHTALAAGDSGSPRAQLKPLV